MKNAKTLGKYGSLDNALSQERLLKIKISRTSNAKLKTKTNSALTRLN